MNLTFAQPDILPLLWLVPVLAVFCLFRGWHRRRMQGRLGQIEAFRRNSRIPRQALDWVHSLCLLLAVASAVLAVARPRLPQAVYEADHRGLDIVFLLDTSPSMSAQDIQPSRFNKAREVIREFLLHKQSGDRVALVGFSDSSMIYAYLTGDAGSLMFYFDYFYTEEESLYGTNLGAAIQSGLAAISRDREITPANAGRQALLVLLSDGDDRGGEVAEAVARAREAKLHVYTVGIGTARGAEIPVRVAGQRQYLMDDRGQRLTSQLHEDGLKSIASTTGARYYRATSGEEIQQALDQVITAERPIQGYRLNQTTRELFPFLLLTAFAAALGVVMIP